MGSSSRPSATGSDFDLESVKAWLATHGRQLIIGSSVVVVIVAGILFARQSRILRSQRADAAYATAQGDYYAGNQAQARTALQTLVDRYPGTSGGTLGGMLLAQVQYDERKYDDGIKGLQSLLGAAPARYRAMIEDLIATGYADSKRPADAIDHYMKAAAAAEYPADRDLYQADAARVLQSSGKRDSARAIWAQLAERTDSPTANEAKVRLGELDAKPITPQ